MLTLPDLATLERLDRSSLAQLFSQVKALEGLILAKLLGAQSPSSSQSTLSKSTDRTLDANEIALALGVNRRWVFRNLKKLPFVRRISRKVLACSEAALRRWLENQKA